MHAQRLYGRDAEIATLRAKVGIATSRLAWSGLPKKQRVVEQETLDRCTARLDELAAEQSREPATNFGAW